MSELTAVEMEAVLDAHYKYEAANDVDGVVSTLTDDVVHDVVGFPGGPLQGRDAARRFYQQGNLRLPSEVANLAYARLPAQDLERARRFYADALDVEPFAAYCVRWRPCSSLRLPHQQSSAPAGLGQGPHRAARALRHADPLWLEHKEVFADDA